MPLLTRNIRLGVTGLRRTGKTVFLTALIYQLLQRDIPPISCVREGGQAGQNRGFIEQPSEAMIFPTTGPRNRFPDASPAEDTHDHNSARPPIQE